MQRQPNAKLPLMTQVYQDNYPAASRGRFFSHTVMIRIVTAAAFGGGGGYLLALDIGYFRVLLAMFAAALGFSSWCLRRVPSTPLHLSGGRHPLRAFAHVRDDFHRCARAGCAARRLRAGGPLADDDPRLVLGRAHHRRIPVPHPGCTARYSRAPAACTAPASGNDRNGRRATRPLASTLPPISNRDPDPATRR
jgi:hypothetical protein